MRRSLLPITSFLGMALGISLLHAQPAAKGKASSIEGTWEGFAVEGKGENPNRGPMQLRLVVKGDTMVGTNIREKKGLGEGTFKLDSKAKSLDATGNVIGAGNNRSYLGIYTLEGDTLRWCVSNFQIKNRPTVLETKQGQFLMILKKVKS